MFLASWGHLLLHGLSYPDSRVAVPKPDSSPGIVMGELEEITAIAPDHTEFVITVEEDKGQGAAIWRPDGRSLGKNGSVEPYPTAPI